MATDESTSENVTDDGLTLSPTTYVLATGIVILSLAWLGRWANVLTVTQVAVLGSAVAIALAWTTYRHG